MCVCLLAMTSTCNIMQILSVGVIVKSIDFRQMQSDLLRAYSTVKGPLEVTHFVQYCIFSLRFTLINRYSPKLKEQRAYLT